ncbi:GNAT family N-acetyltransferase [Acrocarpospora sp. B8E8]|uniref:GNAT family N-acetyltransferase n=1 Tax=Acrocarpospora sp. B8E8 TaxID=3153572 RepID=UPI00325DEF1F
MGVVIRWAKVGDLAGLVGVELAADGMFAEVGITFPAGTTMIEGCTEPGRVIVAGRPAVGFALVGWVDGVVHLDQLAVRPEDGGRGIGGALLQAVCEHAAAVSDAVTLTTFRDVPWNAPWYARRGFAVLEAERWGPEMARLVAYERESGIAVEPRVVMRRDV